jgi:hypothetical protein
MALVQYFTVNRQDQRALEDLQDQVNTFLATLAGGTPVETSLKFSRYEIVAEIIYGDGVGGQVIGDDGFGNVILWFSSDHKNWLRFNVAENRFEFALNDVVVGIVDENGPGQPS